MSGDELYRPPDAALESDDPGSGVAPPGAVRELRGTRPWVIFMAIVSFVGSGFALLGGIGVTVMGSLAPAGAGPDPLGGRIWILGIVYILFGLLYVYPGVRLLQYALAIGKLIRVPDAAQLAKTLVYQRLFWRFAAILTILVIVGYFVLIVVLVGLGVSGILQSPTQP